MQWRFLSQSIPAGNKQLQQILLDNRQISDEKEFFSPTKPDKLGLEQVGIDKAQLQLAVKRIKRAITDKEKVVVFGDYDADGIAATAIIWRALRAAGLETTPFIPLRDVHGYGLSVSALKELNDTFQPTLIVTVDNGIVAHEAAQYLQQQKIDLIITDHHQPELDVEGDVDLPTALAVVHTSQLCGASVAWMLAKQLSPKSADNTLELAGLATIADQVPLKGANRSFAYHGLIALRKSNNVGLQSLAEVAQLDLKTANSGSIGFTLAPRINAMGRLAHGLDALRLLCTNNKRAAQKLASLLAATNLDRQDMTQEQYQLALEQAAEQKNQSLIFVASDKFHEGVVGLIAGRLMERFSKPTIAVSINHEMAKGSARSIAGVNIIKLLREVKEDLLEVGGHPMAAGFGVALDKIDVIKDRLFELAAAQIDSALLKKQLDLECALPFHLVTLQIAEQIDKFAPFGMGNQQPLFAINGLKVDACQAIGKNQKHLKLQLSSVGKDVEMKPVTALYWGNGHLAENVELGTQVAVAAKVEINEWRNRKTVQLVIRDVQVT